MSEDLLQLPWYALEAGPPDPLGRCPKCNGLTYVEDDLWGSAAGEYVIGCIQCGFRFMGLVIGGAQDA